jgi:hypothetical protein
MRRTSVFAAVVLFGAGYPAHAENGIGAGGVSCGDWIASRTSKNIAAEARAAMTQQWILGFLSGVAMYKSAVSDAIGRTDATGIFAWVDNHCRESIGSD